MNSDWIELISIFKRLGIRYLVAGGHAVAFHSQPRFTRDIDFAIGSTREDIEKLGVALAEFGFPIKSPQLEEFLNPNTMMSIGFYPNRVDIFNQLKGLDFEKAYLNRINTRYDGVDLAVISLDDLIKTKQASGRVQDLLDLEHLLKLKDPLD